MMMIKLSELKNVQNNMAINTIRRTYISSIILNNTAENRQPGGNRNEFVKEK